MLVSRFPLRYKHSKIDVSPRLLSFIFSLGKPYPGPLHGVFTELIASCGLPGSLRLFLPYVILSRRVCGVSSHYTVLTSSSVVPFEAHHCDILAHFIGVLGTLTTCLGTFLFLERARVVWFQFPWVRKLFNVLWAVAISGLIATTPWTFSATSLEPSGSCLVSDVSKYELVGTTTISIFDIAVFFSIVYTALGFDTRLIGHGARFKAFFAGIKDKPTASALLWTGQLYFL